MILEKDTAFEDNDKLVRDDELPKKISFGRVSLIVMLVALVAITLFGIRSCAKSEKKPLADDEKFPVFYYKNDNNAYIIPSGEKDTYKLGRIDDIESSTDGDIIFFVWDSGTGSDLYFRKTSSKSTDKGVKIAENILSFDATGDGRYVLYTTENNELYLSDKKTSTLIFENVSTFAFSEDENLIHITDNNGGEYLRGTAKSDKPELIDKDIDDVYTANSFEDIYYTIRGDLYHKSGKKQTKLLSDTVEVLSPKKGVFFAVTTDFDSDELNVRLYSLDKNKAREIKAELSSVACFSRDWIAKRADSAEDEYLILKSDGSLISVNLSDKSDFYLSKDEKYFYCIENRDLSSGEGVFVRYTLSKKGLTLRKEIAQNVDIFTFAEDEEYILLRGKESGIYIDGDYRKLSDNDIYFVNVLKDGTVCFIDDYINGSLVIKKDGKSEKLDSNVRSIRVKGEHLYYVKSTDLYYKKGDSEAVIIDSDVGNFDVMPPSCY